MEMTQCVAKSPKVLLQRQYFVAKDGERKVKKREAKHRRSYMKYA